MRNEGRLRRLARTVAAALLAATMLLAAATTAQASIQLSDDAGSPLVDQMVFDGQPIEVHGSEIPDEAEGASAVALALCDIDGATEPEELGTRCDDDHAVSFTSVATYVTNGSGAEPALLTVEDTFDNFDFTINEEGFGSTECAGTAGDEDCAVVVSYYTFAPFPVFLYAEAEEVTFEEQAR